MFGKERIMVVEDESLVSESLNSCLLEMGYKVTSIETTGKAAIDKAFSDIPDLILMDIKLEDNIDGIKASNEIKKKINIPIVYISSLSDKKTLDEILKNNPAGYLIKPFRIEELRTSIHLALQLSLNDKKDVDNPIQKINIFLLADKLISDCIKVSIKSYKENFLVDSNEHKFELEKIFKINRPDLLIIEKKLFESESELISLVRKISKGYEDIKIMIFSDINDFRLNINLIAAGVSGFIGKNMSNNEFLKSVYTLYNNGTWFDEDFLIRTFQKKLEKQRKDLLPNVDLTKKETEVLTLAMHGLSNKAISNEIFVSENTVKTHLTNIFKKMGVGSKKELIIKFGENRTLH